MCDLVNGLKLSNWHEIFRSWFWGFEITFCNPILNIYFEHKTSYIYMYAIMLPILTWMSMDCMNLDEV